MKVSVNFFRFLQARLITVVLVFFKIETEQDYFIFQVCVITLLKLWMPYANIVGLVMKYSTNSSVASVMWPRTTNPRSKNIVKTNMDPLRL